jgi:hypothetical protein
VSKPNVCNADVGYSRQFPQAAHYLRSGYVEAVLPKCVVKSIEECHIASRVTFHQISRTYRVIARSDRARHHTQCGDMTDTAFLEVSKLAQRPQAKQQYQLTGLIGFALAA